MDFRSFFRALNDHSPFPWQEQAARRLLAGDTFDAVTVPTGCGKTALIDAALYHAAHGGPRRIFFIIDRRVVVDEAHDRARRIAERIAGEPCLSDFAESLGEVSVVRLRGGVQGDDDWVWHPEKVTVVLTTVDQVGSRLLHRGYGVSPRMWPVHAGFVGNNALYLIDEAHLSQPFAATVKAASVAGADIRLVRLSATLGAQAGTVLSLERDDRENPVLARRLGAVKLAQLESVPDPDNQFAPRVADRAEALAEPGFVVGIVVNRVRSARQVFEVLVQRKRDVKLLIGPIRPYDRDKLMEDLMPRIRAGRKRDEGDPLFIVATQTIEVGADLDFDALVAECAPISSLRQRFGRLDRLGERGESYAWILGRERQVDPATADKAPVYGAAVARAWEWLERAAERHGGSCDFGISAFEQDASEYPLPEEASQHCPPLLPTHIELFAQTGPDAPRIDPAPWLHGPQRFSNDVGVVWRVDLDRDNTDAWSEHVNALRPTNREAVQLPLPVVRDLLLGRGNTEIGDLEGTGVQVAPPSGDVRPFYIWRGSELDDSSSGVSRDFRDLKPGDTVILPANYGGYDEFGWNPKSAEPVSDIAEACACETHTKKPFALRIAHSPLASWAKPFAERLIECRDALVTAVAELDNGDEAAEERIATAWKQLKAELSHIDHRFVTRLGTDFDYQLLSDRDLVLFERKLDEFGGAISGGVPVKLENHLNGVAETVRSVAGQSAHLSTLVAAAELHDVGKAAPVFQNLLYGDPLLAAGSPPLAKSGMRTKRAFEAAKARSGFPDRYRHELYSLDLIDSDDPLLRYLVATHHGYGRPWFPACEDPGAPGAYRAELKNNWAAQFASCLRQLGPWRLAGLELLLRAADVRQSQKERDSKI